MLPVSASWAAAISTNHRPTLHFELWKTVTQLIPDLKISAGSVRKDASTYPRTTASLQIADISEAVAQLCTPFGSRIRIYRGLTYPDNTAELPLIADLDIVSARLARPAAELTVQLADPSAAIASDQFDTPTPMPGVTVRTAISRILASRAYFGGRVPSGSAPAADTAITAADYNVDGDGWDSIEQLADIASAECYFSADRTPILRAEPVLKSTPDATLYALSGGTVTAIDSELIRAPNVLYFWGAPDAAGKQIRGVAADRNQSSPTYVNGPYGRVTAREDRSTPFASQAAANTAAANMLARLQRGVRTVTVECVPNPAIEPGDTVEIRFASGALERHLVRAVEIPAGPSDRMIVECSTTAYTTQGWP